MRWPVHTLVISVIVARANRNTKQVVMNIYSLGSRFTGYALMSLVLVVIFATVDHFLFEERFRHLIKIMGIASLFVFFLGIAIVIIKGLLDKMKE